ncbi:MAG: ribonuclease Y, partial [Opitutales bacterium]|nr:ribonuclease Y [Opitutales bacterium]
AAMLSRLGESDAVVNAVEAHHGEVPAGSVYAIILMVADTLSATRPGARMEATEGYIRRIKSLEGIALGFEGVAGAYVLQAGRELRVIVSPDTVGDVEAREIARKIRARIEETINNSMPVKITLIRETRFTETAKPRGG